MIENEKNNLLGIGFILLACLSMTISALFIRAVGQGLGSFETVMIRCSFTLFFVLVLNRKMGKALFHSPAPFMLSVRSIMVGFIVFGNFYGLVHLPLVQVTSLQFTKSLFLVVLAALFLGERVHLPRTIATFAGFIGVLIILRPTQELDPIQMLVLMTAFLMAIATVLVKKLTRTHSSSTLVFYANLAAILLCLGPAIANWQTPDLYQITMIAGLGLSAYGSQYFIIQAYRYGETTTVTPFEYVRLIFIALAGYLVFAEIPDIWTIVGGAVICGATLFITLREAHKKRLRSP